ncbi:HAD-IC family P-type ATPase [Labrys monachus]|uniref:H+-transporting ATPase n=1 Tax=Labrys monachus TaxID=217067 RepID=A0ABU0F904_9HYPH|nr:HAD-IC family P-type ATPase [Labrys monachus]MDQ0391087.1 H+-transporting ATPase [Labrys monachus]
MTIQTDGVPLAVAVPSGLTTQEAATQRIAFGSNAVSEDETSPLRRVLRHFWAPVPWMLEAAVVLQFLAGERLEALMIAALLLLNVGLGVFQEGRATAALALLKKHLALTVRVRRDGGWILLPSAALVPGDVVQISLGGIVPADITLATGSLLIDQSMLTGESVPAEIGVGQLAYSGGLVRRGEATGTVSATGARTFFGRTAELVRTASVESAEQKAVLGVVRNLTIVNLVIVAGMVAYALHIGMGPAEIIPLVLTALLSVVPVALPATFTLAAALGARTLAAKGVLLTRLSALQEAAGIDVLCADKTGTLTANALKVSAIRPVAPGYDEGDVLRFAALASSADGQDPIDSAIRTMHAARATAKGETLAAQRFVPFDPAVKMAEAMVLDHGRTLRVVKGAPAVIAAVAPMPPGAAAELDRLTGTGHRVLAVAVGPPDALVMIGLVALSDPPRPDSAELLARLKGLGVHPVMVTGDSAATAAAIARTIGLDGPVCPPGRIPDGVGPSDFAVYAGVFPEQKFRLVKAFQQAGHAVGMCGDGANDAPALRQAQMGIAVSTATDVAKAAAGVVLTEPGLGGIVTCIGEGRSAFQRVLTYTLTILVNKCVTLLMMGMGLIVTGHAVLTPLLLALSMLAGDFVTMSRTADHATPSAYPNAWRVGNLTLAAVPLGLFKLLYCVGMLALGWYVFRFAPGRMQTLTFLTLVLAGQANIFILRERGRFWHSRPVPLMIVASTANVVLAVVLAAGGILMDALPAAMIGLLLAGTALFALGMDTVKIAVLSHLRID